METDRWWFVYWDEALEMPAVMGRPPESDVKRMFWMLDRAEEFGRDGDMNQESDDARSA